MLTAHRVSALSSTQRYRRYHTMRRYMFVLTRRFQLVLLSADIEMKMACLRISAGTEISYGLLMPIPSEIERHVADDSKAAVDWASAMPRTT